MAEGGDIPNLSVEDVDSVTEMESGGEDSALQRFLEKSKTDRMYELRQLQLGDRPVTSTDRKESIDNFFFKRLQAQDKAASTGKENVPVNVENVEEVRPETVVVEIQGLVEQQRVSNVLSTGFRHRLENIIRGSISTVARNRTPRPSVSPSPTPQQSASPATQSRATTPVVDRPVPAPRRTAFDRLQRSRSNSSASTDSIPRVPTPPVVHPQEPVPNVNTDSVPNRDTADSGPDFVQRLENAIGNGEITLEEIDQLHREELVQEISELVHRQLVTNTLQGNFRSVLELQLSERQSRTGADGERVQQFVQNLHPSQPILHNDFTHLGLLPHPQQGADNWDNISVTSVSAHNVPYAQSNVYLSREMQSLKAQVEEMKNMLRVSFDLQLDIQRAIRQEVAAAVSKHVDGNTSTEVAVKSKPVNDTHCCICLDSFADSVLYQCGHMCLCYSCGRHLMSRGSKCPVCRAPIKDIIRAYRSTED